MTDLHWMPLAGLAALIAARKLGALELTDALIARAERLGEHYRCYLTPTFDLAREMARAADAEIARGRWRGPLHGMPVGLKDAFDTRGIRTTVASRLFADRVPDRDAFAVRRLLEAAAVLMGKLECTELCLGGPSLDGLVPHSVNPWAPERYAGGSSSGAAVALATGLLPAALGTDTGGSIRFPAALNGVAGFKPTYGLVSLGGVFPLSHSLDHAGPMARTSRDCALILDAIAGHDPDDPTSVRGAEPPRAAAALAAGDNRLDGVRIGHVVNFTEAEGVSPDARAATRAALAVLEDLGANVQEIALPDLMEFTVCNTTIMTSEAFALHGPAFRRRASDVAAFTRARIALGAFIRAEDYVRAQKNRRRLARATDAAMERFDALVYPGSLGAAGRIADVRPFYYLNLPLITAPANIAGVPASSVRAGFDAEGQPMAVQVTGRRFEDALVLRIAHSFETATPELDRRAID